MPCEKILSLTGGSRRSGSSPPSCVMVVVKRVSDPKRRSSTVPGESWPVERRRALVAHCEAYETTLRALALAAER